MTLKAQDSTEERVLAQEHNRTGRYVMCPHLLGISVGALAGGLLLFPSSSLNADLAWGANVMIQIQVFWKTVPLWQELVV